MTADRSMIVCDTPEIVADDFARRFSLRSGNLMWLLGAGASASAGISTAGAMIWEFRKKLFISQRRTSPQVVSDLSSPAIRARLQAHIDSSGNLPPPGSSDEYAACSRRCIPRRQIGARIWTQKSLEQNRHMAT